MKEAELILTHILNCSRADLYLKDFSLDKEKLFKFNFIQRRRKEKYPLAYLLGEIEFFGLNFKIKKGVFIPRQETEILVETVINLVRRQKLIVHKILDVGTGSGCIAVSLKKFLTNVEITALDISEKAIETAKENARLNNVKINFLISDLFNNPQIFPSNYELIVSNPPYIPTKEIESLPKEVQFEPKSSLDGGWDGLDFYRKIIAHSPNYLKEKGLLVMEMGVGQVKKIKEIFKDSNFRILDIVRDYSNIERVIVAQLKYG